MSAKKFIVDNYPVTARDLANQKCVGLNDIAFLCEKYHKSKVKSHDLLNIPMVDEMIKYIIESERILTEGDPWSRDTDQIIKDKCMPDLYYKLITLKSNL